MSKKYSVVWALSSLAVLAAPAMSATTSEDGMTVLKKSRPHVARAGAWQTRSDHITLKDGQEKARLSLKLINGPDGKTALTDLQVELNRKAFLTMKDFGGSTTLTREMDGLLKHGDNLLVVKCFGPSGSTLVWKLLAPQVSITKVSPQPFTPKDTLTVQGQNFSSDLKAVSASISGKVAKVTKATANEIQIKPPSSLHGGSSKLVVKVNGVKSNEQSVAVRANPILEWIDVVATAPRHRVTIKGKGFSSIPSENIVKFRSLRAQVVSASETSICCIVPDMHFPDWHVPITVTTLGMPSKGNLTLNIDARVIPNTGVPMR